MKFPITRECLQTFDYNKAKEDLHKEELESLHLVNFEK